MPTLLVTEHTYEVQASGPWMFALDNCWSKCSIIDMKVYVMGQGKQWLDGPWISKTL